MADSTADLSALGSEGLNASSGLAFLPNISIMSI